MIKTVHNLSTKLRLVFCQPITRMATMQQQVSKFSAFCRGKEASGILNERIKRSEHNSHSFGDIALYLNSQRNLELSSCRAKTENTSSLVRGVRWSPSLATAMPKRLTTSATMVKDHRQNFQEKTETTEDANTGFSPAIGGNLGAKSSTDVKVTETLSSPRAVKNVGAFQQLPAVSPAYEIIGSALKRAKMVKPTKGIQNVAKRERNRGAKQLDAMTKELSGPLGVYIKRFPLTDSLHNFEKALLELTLGDGVYEKTLDRVNNLRKKILSVGKNAAAEVNRTTTKKEAEDKLAEGYRQLEILYERNAHAVDALKEVAKTLRSLPVVHPNLPTLCLVGAPNVGKSSLVRLMSSGKPEVCNYPFTTRGISMGHFFVEGRRHQVTDTPGLLHRPDEDRNNIERLTLAALQHLPSAVLYVHDLTEECGTSVEDQCALHAKMRVQFSSRPWLDVVSKADLLPPPPPPESEGKDKPLLSVAVAGVAEEEDLERYRIHGPVGALRVSTETNEGIENLISKVHEMLATNLLGVHSNEEGSTREELEWDKLNAKERKRLQQDAFYFPKLPPDMLRGN